jgi:DNA-binding response OmpR family regulator
LARLATAQWSLPGRRGLPIIGPDMLIAEPFRSPAFPSNERARRAPARLVLFIGEAMRPEASTAEALARDGVRCLWLAGPAQALRAARLALFDAVVLDGGCVDGDAGRLLAEMRAALRGPILVVGRAADEIDEIVVLESGADAYLAPPFAPRRLRAHITALLRRPPSRQQDEAPACIGGWTLDPLRQALVDGAREVALTEVQTLLLQCLFDAAGALVARAHLMAALPRGERLQVRSVDVYIHRLRQRLRDEGVDGITIEAVRGRGFVLRAGSEAQAA